ncbi:MAG: alpha-ketoglutarate-dependent dioxygenase AlkB [Gammaproteobacteria bacterium]|nr:alpha-ketoglutarate-dependent dioxygenase AlkB [Gammaproteobacteria bacterium]
MTRIEVAPEVVLLHGFAVPTEDYAAAAELISAAAPFRHLKTPGGRPMSAAMTNCGELGWVSDARGYRYEPCDPLTGLPWPAMPATLHELAQRAAAAAGWPGFDPDACLINRYVPGARMGAHRDADERDFSQPIVSVTLGAPAMFFWYGARRAGSPLRIRLEPGDVLVWGGAARRGYHGVGPPLGAMRINLTFRKAG